MNRLVDGVLITDDQIGQKYTCPECEFSPSRPEIKIKGWGKRQKLMKIVRDHKEEKHPCQASLFDYAGFNGPRFNGPRFDGPVYNPAKDQARLSTQIERLFSLMKDERYRTLAEIAVLTGDPEASISANLRHLRKDRFGNHIVTKQRRGSPTATGVNGTAGTWEYRLLVNRP